MFLHFQEYVCNRFFKLEAQMNGSSDVQNTFALKEAHHLISDKWNDYQIVTFKKTCNLHTAPHIYWIHLE